MAATNFAALTDEQKTVWSMDWWMTARNSSFLQRFTGTGQNSVIQRITELTKTTSGLRAVITLVKDMVGDGTTGDNTLEGHEEALQSDENVIQIDQLRFATRSTGKLSDQEGIVKFREESRDKLAYALGDRCDQLGFLTMAGIPYTQTNDGRTRRAEAFDIPGHKLSGLAFAGDVRAPTGARHRRWDGTNKKLVAGDTSAIATADRPSYQTAVRLKAYAQVNYIKGIRGRGNSEMYYWFVDPNTMADLRLDADVLANERNAGPRGYGSNRLWEGIDDMLMLDGITIISHRHVYNNSGANSGSRWGAAGAVAGARTLFCGAQALGMVDLDGSHEWNESDFDYGNRQGIATGKMFGYLKPQFDAAPRYDSKQDFGLIAVDVAYG